MACLQCTETQPIPECVEDLIIGTIESLSTDVYIFVKNLSNGYVHRSEATSSVSGLITLDMQEPDISFYNENHLYESWVTLQSTGINDRLPIIVEGSDEPIECLLLVFEHIHPSDYTTHTISV